MDLATSSLRLRGSEMEHFRFGLSAVIRCSRLELPLCGRSRPSLRWQSTEIRMSVVRRKRSSQNRAIGSFPSFAWPVIKNRFRSFVPQKMEVREEQRLEFVV